MFGLGAGVARLAFDAIPTMAAHNRAGKVKALATTGRQRSASLPKVPTLAESAVPGYEAAIWLGPMAPRGTPSALAARMCTEPGVARVGPLPARRVSARTNARR